MVLAAIDQILAWGVEDIHATLSHLTDYTAALAAESGLQTAARRARLGNMIGIRFPSGVPAGLTPALAAANIFVSQRGDAIRVSPHLYNSTRDIDRLFGVLRKMLPVHPGGS